MQQYCRYDVWASFVKSLKDRQVYELYLWQKERLNDASSRQDAQERIKYLIANYESLLRHYSRGKAL